MTKEYDVVAAYSAYRQGGGELSFSDWTLPKDIELGIRNAAGEWLMSCDDADDARRRMTPPRRVFVYGTLKSGHGNWFHFLKDRATFIGHAITAKQFSMIAGGFPVVLDCEGNRGQIRGEVYDVNNKTLRRLDGLEGFRGEGDPANMYDRKQTEVQIWTGAALITETVGIYIGAGRWDDHYTREFWKIRNSSGQLEWPRATS